MSYQPKDAFYKRAKQEHYAARSVYKLEEIDAKHHLLARGQLVLDLGCSPGSWLQYAGTVVGPSGAVLGYDLAEPRVPVVPPVFARIADAHALTPEQIRADLAAALGRPVDPQPFALLLSDMAPKTTGIHDADQARSIGLVEKALWLHAELVRSEGAFLAKTFQGRGIDALIEDARRTFREVKVLRPKATRDGSREVFVLARQRRAS